MAQSQDVLRKKLRELDVLQGCLDEPAFDPIPATPHEAFQVWLFEAIKTGVKEPHAMTLSTVDEQNWPDARVLILKNVDARGWHFAIKAGSPKGQQIANNGRVALTFYWPEQGRQIRLQGMAIQLPEAECIQDFTERPHSSKISALASQQSSILKNKDDLLQALKTAQNDFSEETEKKIGWKVYAVAPRAVEFWQGAADRLHYRLRYSRENNEGEWDKHMLWP